jgi:hypothetical protein
MRIGDKLYCVKDTQIYDIRNEYKNGETLIITKVSYDEEGDLYYDLICSDNTRPCLLFASDPKFKKNFTTLKKLRKQKLKKINENQ